MSASRARIVLDTNTVLRGLVASSSAATRILRAAEDRGVVPLLSKPVLDEYRAVLLDGAILEKFPELTPELVEVTMRRLRYVSDYLRSPRQRFEYCRDPADAKFIELAIAMRADYIVSSDKDLLSLPRSSSDAGKRFRQRLPGVEVLEAATFVRRYVSDRGSAMG